MTTKRKAFYAIGALFLALLGAITWKLGPALLPPESLNVGIATGSKAPIYMALLDSKGQPASLAAAMGEKGMVLLMVRSADWCPFCKGQLMRSEKIRENIATKGYALVSVSYDKPQKLADFAADKAIHFTMLSDPGSKLIDALGLRDPQYAVGSFAHGVPRPTVLVLAKDGTVKAKYVDADYRSRQSNEQVLAMLAGVRG